MPRKIYGANDKFLGYVPDTGTYSISSDGVTIIDSFGQPLQDAGNIVAAKQAEIEKALAELADLKATADAIEAAKNPVEPVDPPADPSTFDYNSQVKWLKDKGVTLPNPATKEAVAAAVVEANK